MQKYPVIFESVMTLAFTEEHSIFMHVQAKVVGIGVSSGAE